jgi:hypothetical protein
MADVIGSFDVSSFVNATVPAIESALTVTVSNDARDELVNRMRPHEQTVSKDLASMKMNLEELRRILFSVIQKAASFNPGRPIDRAAINQAISMECHYLGWC